MTSSPTRKRLNSTVLRVRRRHHTHRLQCLSAPRALAERLTRRAQTTTRVCAPRRRSFELDIAAPALEPGTAGSRKRRVVIQAIGEARATRLGLSGLARLDHIADQLAGHQRISAAASTKRLLLSLTGFTPDLSEAARRRTDVENWSTSIASTKTHDPMQAG